MSDFEFVPTQNQVEESNIFRFMQKHGLSSLSELSKKSKDELEWFWQEVDKDIGVVWDSPYSQILDSSNGIAHSKWFVNGKTNIYKSTVEKFVKLTPDKTAYHFVSEDGATSKLTYQELDNKVSKLANGLKSLRVKKGDVVAIYLPMIQEAILAILASAKIGAVQTVIFSGYSTESLHIRLQDCNAKVLFVSDGFCRKGKPISQKETVQKAIQDTYVEKTIVVKYKGVDKYENSENIVFYNELIESQNPDCPTEIMDSEDPLFILYTSGTTGKPKGVVHVHGGFSVFAGHQAAYLIDLQAQDVLFWPADIGWITGLVWNVYGLLIMGASSVIYDGALDFPKSDRVWKILSEYNATIFGISPTATRLFKKNNEEPLQNFSLDKIKNIPTTGEPLDEDSWWWLFDKVGNKKIPIMNLSGGTEIGGAMLSVFPGMKLKPSTVGIPVPGMNLDVVDNDGNSVKNKNGYLIIRSPWPGMTRGLLNDNERFIETYWSRFKDIWFHGDYVFVDQDGLWYMRGRTDDVINVSGHRMSTAEIEHMVISHEKISDAASIAIPDDITGEAIVIFFVADSKDDSNLEGIVSDFISQKIGKVAKPKFVYQLTDLPKTRTGKIMRRLLKSKLLGKELGDLSSLENPQILDEVPKIG
ncbi:AMP-binding protein [Nitrosopumilus maritimus]|uniref:acetate--CoA ligase n=1 Tax=Nitrosopumilus maritimus (strain SCM1) TaxID=436308 RepID=A9A1C7_NITMS|nr:AMP-binding protein [Nitrosopumilus maritimus]ABX12762.1 AMP-dependent synthetase and ligase [Nitrosopumilus maritimus SCM1]